MREHDALGQACGTRGVREHHHVISGINRNLLKRLTHVVSEWCGVLGSVDRDDLGHVGTLDGLACDVDEHGDRDDHVCAGVLQLVPDLAGTVCGVDGGERCASGCNTVEHHGVLGQIRRHQRNTGTDANPAFGEASGETTSGLLELGECVLVAMAVGHCDAIGVRTRLREDMIGNRHLRDRIVGQVADMDQGHWTLHRWGRTQNRSFSSETPVPMLYL